MTDIKAINDLFNDIWNFHLVLFGIAMSIFTLLYSFILTKRDELKIISESIKSGDKDPILIQKQNFAKNYIVKLKKTNDKIIIIILVSFCLFIINWVYERFVSDCKVELKRFSLFISFGLTFLLLLFLFYILYEVYKRYKNETKI